MRIYILCQCVQIDTDAGIVTQRQKLAELTALKMEEKMSSMVCSRPINVAYTDLTNTRWRASLTAHKSILGTE